MTAPGYRGGTAPVAGGAVSSPAGTQVGDLVVVYTWERTGAGSPTFTLQSGNDFVEIRNHAHDDGSTDGRLAVAYKIATQAGAQSYQAYTTGTGSPAWFTGCIVLTAGTYDVGSLPPSAPVSQTNNAVPNPPQVASLNAANAYLILAVAAWHLASAATVTPTAPSGYGNLLHIAGSSTSELASATITGTGATSFDPGTFGDDVAPNGTAAITVAFVGVPPEEGSGTSALTLATSGAGVSARYGGGSSALSLGTQGEGRTVHYGLAVAALVLALAGEGEAPVVETTEGSGTAALTLSTEGDGRTVHSGAGSVALSLGATGEGRTVHSGLGSAALSLSSTGVGESSRSGAGAAALSLSTTGEGRTVHSGAGVPALSLLTTGDGRTQHSGAGDAELTLSVEGEGEEPTIETDGFGVAALTLAVQGEGRAVHAGAGASSLTIATTGEGRTVHAGLASVPISLGVQGEGRSTRAGSGDAALSLALQGEGDNAEVELLPAYEFDLTLSAQVEAWDAVLQRVYEFDFIREGDDDADL